jgi:hypothetical protein
MATLALAGVPYSRWDGIVIGIAVLTAAVTYGYQRHCTKSWYKAYDAFMDESKPA